MRAFLVRSSHRFLTSNNLSKKMIQRIQTVFLFLAAVMAVVSNFLAFGIEWKNSNPDGVWLGANTDNSTNLVLFFCMIITGGLAFTAIFLFKNRDLQLKITLAASLFALISLVLVCYWIYVNIPADIQRYPSVGAFIPMGIILSLLFAVKNIKKDETLVKSMDRLR